MEKEAAGKVDKARKKTDNQINSSVKSKLYSIVKVFSIMCVCLFVVFSYVYQSTKQVYLNYEIANLKKEINTLDINLRQSQVENQKIKTNEYIERIASENLGMSYQKSDKIIVIKEDTDNLTNNSFEVDNEMTKLQIFMKSLYQEINTQLKAFDIKNIIKYFSNKE